MNTVTLYRDLTMQGVTLYLDGGALRYRAPKGKMTPDVLANIKTHKLELISLLATNDHDEKVVVNEVSTNGENLKTTAKFSAVNAPEKAGAWSMDRYAHLITCQQCEHLTATGYCRGKLQVKPMLEAMHDCASFEVVSGERVAITQTVTYTAIELLTRCENSLFNHLLNCSICHIERGEYCLQGKERGKNYDDVLLPFDDAQAKRESLSLRVDKALISGRSIFGARK